MNGKPDAQVALPPIPAKRYFTIGEVSELCGVKPHVLRYWEQEFTQLRPMKRRGNRRYYQHHEVLLVRRIRELLYEEGFTINGARNRLSEMSGSRVRSGSAAVDDSVATQGDELSAGLVAAQSGGGSVAGSVASPATLTQSQAVSSALEAAGSTPRRSTTAQQALPFSTDESDAQQAVREALRQALDLLR
jgi:DNA-binding transcriptional MerR regulator